MALPDFGGLQTVVSTLQNLTQNIAQLNTTLKAVLPVVQSTATTATSGSQTLPANPAGFLNVTLPNGTAAKVPYYDQ